MYRNHSLPSKLRTYIRLDLQLNSSIGPGSKPASRIVRMGVIRVLSWNTMLRNFYFYIPHPNTEPQPKRTIERLANLQEKPNSRVRNSRPWINIIDIFARIVSVFLFVWHESYQAIISTRPLESFQLLQWAKRTQKFEVCSIQAYMPL